MIPFTPLRTKAPKPAYGPNDYLVLFGELFGKGYANGIVEEAHRMGMKIIGTTVGRRNAQGELHALAPDDLEKTKALAPFHAFINVPLEAGFDLEKSRNARSIVDQLHGVRMDDWDKIQLSWPDVEDSRKAGEERFVSYVRAFLKELADIVKPGSNVVFVHTMAGGIPRAKILMPTMNKIFKGRGDRFLSSEKFWTSQLGKLTALSFLEVTAHTYKHLLNESRALREHWSSQGSRVSYVAYGYHGTEILIGGQYRWQSYSPYLQGFAKMELERHSVQAFHDGVQSCVFNCPEILTNSSNLFQGVELPLYPFIGALRREGEGSERAEQRLNACQNLLLPQYSLEQVLKFTDSYFTSDLILNRWTNYEVWPQHNGPEHMDVMLNASNELIAMHKDEKATLTLELSRDIFEATGMVMLAETWKPRHPVVWLGHDILAKTLVGRA